MMMRKLQHISHPGTVLASLPLLALTILAITGGYQVISDDDELAGLPPGWLVRLAAAETKFFGKPQSGNLNQRLQALDEAENAGP